jgi:hypothetical protein
MTQLSVSLTRSCFSAIAPEVGIPDILRAGRGARAVNEYL